MAYWNIFNTLPALPNEDVGKGGEMKRDARIGLAVVLVLGLGVTLLVGRALYKHGPAVDNDGEQFATKDTQSDLGDTDNPAKASISGSTQLPATSAAVPSGAQGFIQEQSNLLPQKPIAGAPAKPGDPLEEQDDTQVQPLHGGKKLETAQTTVEYRSYTVVNGDSPWTISSKIFGDGKYTQKIVEANDLSSKKMKVGMTLRIPTIPNKPMILKLPLCADSGAAHVAHESIATKPAPANTTSDNHTTTHASKSDSYKIETGDTLSIIAKKHYGSNGPKIIQLIVAANHGLDPAKLKVGQEITLPAVK